MQGNNSSNDDRLILFVVAIVAVAVAYWYFSPIWQVYWLTSKMWLLQGVNAVYPQAETTVMIQALQNNPPSSWSDEQINYLAGKANMYLAPFFVGFAAYAAAYTNKSLYLVRKSKGKAYNIQSLMQQEVGKVWRYLQPIAHLNLLKESYPEWHRAIKPQEFVQIHKLLKDEKDLLSLDKEKAKKALALQLGDLYISLDLLPKHAQALVGIFAEHIYGSPLRATMAFMDIADSFGEGRKPDYTAGLVLLEKHKNNRELLSIMESHAFVYTAMSALFEKAKTLGIIITKYFIWLKKVDRRMYYTLNRVGRQVSWIECAGIVDQYQHEKEVGRPLFKIYVHSALDGLIEELGNVKLTEQNTRMLHENRDTLKATQDLIYQ